MTLKEFREWAGKQGSVGNPTTVKKNQYKGQCVSLIQQYLYRVYGVPYAPRGHAKDFVPPKFKKVTGKPQVGDIIRYSGSFRGSGGYGHIGMIDDRGKFLDQNGVKKLAIGSRAAPYSGIDAIFRPITKTVPKPAPAKVYTTVRSGEGLSSIARRSGYKDFLLPSAWIRLSRLNGYGLNWRAFNKALKAKQKIRIK